MFSSVRNTRHLGIDLLIRLTAIGEMLRGVAVQNAGDDVAGIDARLELLRVATANLEENAGYVHDGNEWVRAE